jgi:hypothetical protein
MRDVDPRARLGARGATASRKPGRRLQQRELPARGDPPRGRAGTRRPAAAPGARRGTTATSSGRPEADAARLGQASFKVHRSKKCAVRGARREAGQPPLLGRREVALGQGGASARPRSTRSTSTPTSRSRVTAQATSPAVWERLKRSRGRTGGARSPAAPGPGAEKRHRRGSTAAASDSAAAQQARGPATKETRSSSKSSFRQRARSPSPSSAWAARAVRPGQAVP